MSAALSSELLKVRTTRAFLVLFLVAVGLDVLITVIFAAVVDPSQSDIGQDLTNTSGLSQIFALLIGILVVTNEFRHGTITPTLLVVPDRTRLVLAKLAAAVLLGLAIGIACAVLNSGLGYGILALRDIPAGVSVGDVAGAQLASILAVVLWAAIGVGVGALVRNQVGAIVGALVWLFVVETALSAIPTVGDWIADYGPGGASAALTAQSFGDQDTLGRLPGGLLLAAYCLVLVAGGIAVLRRRDVA